MILLLKLIQASSKVSFSTKTNAAIRSMAKHISVYSSTAEQTAIKYLKVGCVIAVPTDTVYGLACDATSVSAISKLYAIKARNLSKPLAICVSDIKDVNVWAETDHLPNKLLGALLPGPVTLILRCVNPTLIKSLNLKGKVAIRIPDYPFIRSLSRYLKKPLALTSANISNEPSAIEVSEFNAIWDKIPCIFDGGRLECNGSASTIVDLSEPDIFHITRKGAAYEETVKILEIFGLKHKK